MAAEERGSPREAVCGLAPLAEENGGKPGGGSDVESQATFRGSWQEDAPPPYDLSPPLSRAPSEALLAGCRERAAGVCMILL